MPRFFLAPPIEIQGDSYGTRIATLARIERTVDRCIAALIVDTARVRGLRFFVRSAA